MKMSRLTCSVVEFGMNVREGVYNVTDIAEKTRERVDRACVWTRSAKKQRRRDNQENRQNILKGR